MVWFVLRLVFLVLTGWIETVGNNCITLPAFLSSSRPVGLSCSRLDNASGRSLAAPARH
ncbi:BgtTE-56111 [Blumeria graminis f. sp. tritici]|uniref:BgtTE-56059 n=1 Tax=Blumeria graminis f. sp. tritici TaxID=62690 RepID=A0A9X9QEE9_BLUGR|nr:BgtTE-56059 [Blumeria graminis f. sp. tritici]VDB90745.1 BgtTE-56093 [Blumeria graminis f. sp. tritici]VDB93190.1 BgtTE-56111 [Blumeria graminis f. sp. tritici]